MKYSYSIHTAFIRIHTVRVLGRRAATGTGAAVRGPSPTPRALDNTATGLAGFKLNSDSDSDFESPPRAAPLTGMQCHMTTS